MPAGARGLVRSRGHEPATGSSAPPAPRGPWWHPAIP